MKLTLVLLLGVAFTGVSAGCINSCSGHGFCGAYDLCSCYGNWAGNDCSGRVCPETKAWVDTAIATDDAHNYATCGNKGDCNGKSGECACYEPFEGKGCRRMACPNGCSGHGTCEFIEELALNNKCIWDSAAQATNTDCVHSSITGLAGGVANNPQDISYGLWDRNKIQGCQCDPGWSGIDCSGRICPMGNDPLRTRTTDDLAVQVATNFEVHVGWVADVEFQTAEGLNPTFVLAFTDTYNEKWYTRPISLNSDGTSGHLGAMTAATSTALASNVYNALLDLPNAAITGTSMDPVTGVASAGGPLGQQALSVSAAALGTGAAQDHAAVISITFNSPHNSGSLANKLECHIAGCDHVGSDGSANPGGCSPKYQGVGEQSALTCTGAADCEEAGRQGFSTDAECVADNSGLTPAGTDGSGCNYDGVTEYCTVETAVSGTTNQDTCSSRGSCDGGSGLCTCYEGYTDEDCSMQTVLV